MAKMHISINKGLWGLTAAVMVVVAMCSAAHAGQVPSGDKMHKATSGVITKNEATAETPARRFFYALPALLRVVGWHWIGSLNLPMRTTGGEEGAVEPLRSGTDPEAQERKNDPRWAEEMRSSDNGGQPEDH